MVAKNDITSDAIASRMTTDAYRDNYDRIFGKKNEAQRSSQGSSDSAVQDAGSTDQEAKTATH